MGDKCSVKRSVIGRHCRIGSNVKVGIFSLFKFEAILFILQNMMFFPVSFGTSMSVVFPYIVLLYMSFNAFLFLEI